MKSNNPPIRHHYIPAFYLRRWCGPDGRLIEYRKPYNRVVSKSTTPEATGYKDRLYELQGFSPSHAQQVEEKFFKPLDTLASHALGLIENSGSATVWNNQSRSAWTRFLLSLLLRCPEDIDLIRAKWRQDFQTTSRSEEARYIEARNAEGQGTFSEYLGSLPLDLTEKYLYDVYTKLVDNKFIGNIINRMNWGVLRIPEGAPSLFTSDRPVIRTNRLDQPHSHIALPIGPRLLFIASNDHGLSRKIARINRRDLVADCNRQVVEAANNFVYSLDRSRQRFVDDHFGQSPQERVMERIVARPKATEQS